MDKNETIEISPGLQWYLLPDQPENPGISIDDPKKERRKRKIYSVQKTNPLPCPTIPDVARNLNLKMGDKGIRQVGRGDIPEPGQRIEANGWSIMRATDYSGIVPQDGLNLVQKLLDWHADINELLIAVDKHEDQPGKVQQFALRMIERLKAIDWRKVKTEFAQDTLVLASVISAIATPVFSGVKRRAKEVNWGEVRKVLGKGLRVLALATVCFGGVVVALPILAIGAVLTALLSFDPMIIAVDSEKRLWVIYEWYD